MCLVVESQICNYNRCKGAVVKCSVGIYDSYMSEREINNTFTLNYAMALLLLFLVVAPVPAANNVNIMPALSILLLGNDEIIPPPPPPPPPPSELLGLPIISDSNWDYQAVRRVLNVFAFGGHARVSQINAWARMSPHIAIKEMLTFAEHNLKLSPLAYGERYTAPAYNYGKIWDFSEDFISSNSANHSIPRDKDSDYSRSQYSLSEWNFPGLWAIMVTTRGLNPFRQRIGFWETNYHMAVNLNTPVNHHQLAKYYDDILEALEAGKPYYEVIAIAASSAAVATQYGHRFNKWNRTTNECECNEDFARELHQLFFGILGEADPMGVENHENMTIKNTAKALTDMRVDWSDQLRRLPENVTFGTANHYPASRTLNILNREISGSNARHRIRRIAQIAIRHPESLKNLPVKIIASLADDNLSDQKKQQLRNAWKKMKEKNLLTFLQAYAVSTLFHDSDRVKYWTSAERQLMMANKLVLNNTEGIGVMRLYNPVNTWEKGMESEQFHLFRPTHNVFGGQTAQEASDAAAIFENNYNRFIWDHWRVERFTMPDVFPNWEKNWASVLPATANGKYQVDQVARWLWRHFLNDNLENFGPLEKAHVYSLLATRRDFPFLMCLRKKRIEAGITLNSLRNLEDDYSELCGGWNNTFSQEDIDLLQGAYSTSDASSGYVTSWVNQMAGRQLKLKSNNFDERRIATQRIGAAINFILSTPYIFAEQGN